ncbi:MAG TPA: carboxypeptidase-like regulatory domain-containing protein [Pyrinomonadaceae bacterium]|nr:carboxypeptidase regulatory-like domain-containing protein [Acidobacteriota bacterium]HQZ95238.1 carboxypeptidase-like regulatory domain-containing protein [Pyrinomonadaceae bacterium]
MLFSTRTQQLLLTTFVMLMAIGVAPASSSAAINVTVEKAGPLGVVRGFVRDDSGSPIADAAVAIFHSGTTKLLKQVTAGRDGSFLAKIVPGTYTVLAVAQGFNPSYIFGVDVGRSTEISYGFKLERAGNGNTLPEKRLDKNSSKWRIRAAQMQRAIYQNQEGSTPIDDDAVAENDDTDDRTVHRKGQTVFETYFAGSDRGSYSGINFATFIPVGETTDFVVAGQTGIGGRSPQRLETSLKLNPIDGHQLRFNSSVAKLGNVAVGNETKQLGQISIQGLDEWKIREGVILVYGLDYSRFFSGSDDSSLSPRVGLQFDINAKTRLRSAFTTQTEEKTWANAIDLEGQNVAFSDPVAVEDLVVEYGKPQINRSRRLEFGIERIIDNRSSVEANVFFDTTLGRGVGINSFAIDNLGGDGFGDFVANQQGRAQGVRVVYSRRVSDILSASVGYSAGNGQKLSNGAAVTSPSKLFENDFFQTFFAQLAADLKTGTSVRTIYRLSPQATVFAIDPFKGRLAIYDPGLSVFVTQSLPTLGLPIRAQAIVDARNIFDFQSGVFGEEGGLRLNAHRRMVRGGIQVRF